MQDHYSTKGKHLTLPERRLIGRWYKEGLSHRKIARRLEKTPQTIHNEFKRLLKHKRYGYYEWIYDPEYSQLLHDKHKKNCGVTRTLTLKQEKKITRWLILKYSPEIIAHRLHLSTGTIYNWIHKRLFKVGLLYPRKSRSVSKKVSDKPRIYGLSIDERPESIHSRDVFGHWEIDTVLLGKTRNACLLTLTERQTRCELIRLIPNKTNLAVNLALLDLQKEIHHGR